MRLTRTVALVMAAIVSALGVLSFQFVTLVRPHLFPPHPQPTPVAQTAPPSPVAATPVPTPIDTATPEPAPPQPVAIARAPRSAQFVPSGGRVVVTQPISRGTVQFGGMLAAPPAPQQTGGGNGEGGGNGGGNGNGGGGGGGHARGRD